MQPYLLSVKERVRHWRNFRLSFSKNETDNEQLLKTIKYWNVFPITIGHFLDVDFPDKWLTPWELISNGNFCQASITYMMMQTLLLSDERWTNDRLQLMYIDDKEKSSMLLILVIDNKKVINYQYDSIIEFDVIKANCIIQHKYKIIGNKYKII